MTWSDKFRLYAPTSQTQGAFTLAAGRTTIAALKAAGLPVFWLGPDADGGQVKRWCDAIPFGDGADNATFDYRVWAGYPETTLNRDNVIDSVQLSLLGSGTVTLCATLGAAGGLVGAAQRYADTITWATATESTSPKGEGSMLFAQHGAPEPAVYSPGGELRARLLIPHCGKAKLLVFEPDLTGATGANWLLAAGD